MFSWKMMIRCLIGVAVGGPPSESSSRSATTWPPSVGSKIMATTTANLSSRGTSILITSSEHAIGVIVNSARLRLLAVRSWPGAAMLASHGRCRQHAPGDDAHVPGPYARAEGRRRPGITDAVVRELGVPAQSVE